MVLRRSSKRVKGDLEDLHAVAKLDVLQLGGHLFWLEKQVDEWLRRGRALKRRIRRFSKKGGERNVES